MQMIQYYWLTGFSYIGINTCLRVIGLYARIICSSINMAPSRLYALAGQNLILTILILLVRRRRVKRQTRREYVRRTLTNRRRNGEYHTLTQEQRLYDHQSHKDTFRMTPSQMQTLLEKVGGGISHKPSHINPIDPDERLAVTLK